MSNKLRNIRLRLGWSQSEMARHLGCPLQEITIMENDSAQMNSQLSSALEMLERQCDMVSEELHNLPIIESVLDENGLDQVATDRQDSPF